MNGEPHFIMQRLTREDLVEAARQRIATIFQQHAEWFHITDESRSFTLRRSELDVSVSHGRLILSCWTETGSRSWKINSWDWTGEKLVLEASRRMGAEKPLIELVPRASASAITATVKAARQARCGRLAELACASLAGARIERAALSPGIRRGQPGRYGRIILRTKHQRIAVTAPVTSHRASDVDAFLSAALLWFTRTGERIRPPYIEQLWLVVEGDMLKATLPRVALLRQGLKDSISVFEIDNSWNELASVEIPSREELWRKRVTRFRPSKEPKLSATARLIVAEAPNAIDVVQARHGETLRFHGLPFARVRRLLETERVWFGLEGSRRRLLDERNLSEWTNLLSDLSEHRSATETDSKNELYRTAAEAWLESILRRDITKLDPGLIIAPIHAQFRAGSSGQFSARPIDLLALRRDGRLVVIELKVSEAREHVLQGVGYWQRVEAHRRRGHISRAKLFGTRRISDESPLVYLVAPTLRVHRAFSRLARFIAPDIEIYRFDINEDWRSGVRVMRRMRAN